MTKYFAILDDHDRRGPFDSMCEAIELLKTTSHNRRYSSEEAQHFFLHESAMEKAEIVDGKTECFRLDWLAWEQAGRAEDFSPEEVIDTLSKREMTRKQENDVGDAHFTVAARKAAEVNEGGLVDPKVP